MKEIERRLSRLEGVAGDLPDATTIDLDRLSEGARQDVESCMAEVGRLDPAKLATATLRELLDLRKVEFPTEIWVTSPATEDDPNPDRFLLWRHPDHQPDPE